MVPRNFVVKASIKLKRKAGAHGKSNKAMRRSEKVRFDKGLEAFMVKQ